jgi:hypothetical protein
MSTSSVGRPGKYQRSAGGLVAALVVTVVAVGGLLWVLGLFRPDVDVQREPIDYLEDMEALQDAGFTPVYPQSLPGDWIATEVDTADGIQLQMLTDDEEFVSVVQSDASDGELLEQYVDDEGGAEPTEIIQVRGSVAEAWQGYADDGGDTAYSAQVGKETVLVYGSASPEELQDLIGRLTRKPVAD